MQTIAWRDLKRRIKSGDVDLETALSAPAAADHLVVEVVALALLGGDEGDQHANDAPVALATAGVFYAARTADLTPASRGELCRLTASQRAAAAA